MIVESGLEVLNGLDRRNEPISSSRNSLDKRRFLGRVAERLTRLSYGRVQTVLEIDERIGLPQPLAQFLASHDLTSPLDERKEDLTRVFLQANGSAIAVQLPVGSIQLEPSKP